MTVSVESGTQILIFTPDGERQDTGQVDRLDVGGVTLAVRSWGRPGRAGAGR